MRVPSRRKADFSKRRLWRKTAIRPKTDFSHVRHSVIRRTKDGPYDVKLGKDFKMIVMTRD
jgi:hypothetical protein